MIIKRLNALLLLLLSLVFIGCSDEKESAEDKVLPRKSVVLAIGDSLTQGVGADEAKSYPAQLANLSEWTVINAGVSGETSADVLARIDSELNTHHPALVLLSIGGNDFLGHIETSVTRTNIEKTIQIIQKRNIPLILIAYPELNASSIVSARVGLTPKDAPLYQELAQQYQLPLLALAWGEVLGDEQNRSDQIHANAQGYRLFADKLYQFLRQQGYTRY